MIDIKKSSRGTLVPIYQKDFKNNFKRILIIKDVPKNSTRGNHAHRKEEQIIFILRGKIEISTENFLTTKKIILNENDHIILPSLTWNIFKFLEEDSSMLVIGSENFDEKEYIFDYNEFVSLK